LKCPGRKRSSAKIPAHSALFDTRVVAAACTIQVCFVACHLAKLTGGYSGTPATLINWLFIPGSPQLFVALVKPFQFLTTIAKRDRFEQLKRSLSITHIMVSSDTCPQGTFNAAVDANLRRHYRERFSAGTVRARTSL
jgi:hypothetical protein